MDEQKDTEIIATIKVSRWLMEDVWGFAEILDSNSGEEIASAYCARITDGIVVETEKLYRCELELGDRGWKVAKILLPDGCDQSSFEQIVATIEGRYTDRSGAVYFKVTWITDELQRIASLWPTTYCSKNFIDFKVGAELVVDVIAKNGYLNVSKIHLPDITDLDFSSTGSNSCFAYAAIMRDWVRNTEPKSVSVAIWDNTRGIATQLSVVDKHTYIAGIPKLHGIKENNYEIDEKKVANSVDIMDRALRDCESEINEEEISSYLYLILEREEKSQRWSVSRIEKPRSTRLPTVPQEIIDWVPGKVVRANEDRVGQYGPYVDGARVDVSDKRIDGRVVVTCKFKKYRDLLQPGDDVIVNLRGDDDKWAACKIHQYLDNNNDC